MGRVTNFLKRIFKYGMIEIRYFNTKNGKELTKANSGFCLKGLCLSEPETRSVTKVGRDGVSSSVTIPSGWVQFFNSNEVKMHLLNIDKMNEKVILLTTPQFNLEVGKT